PSPLCEFGKSSKSSALVEELGECQICFEALPLPHFCRCCVDARRCCAGCLRTYFQTSVEDALYAMPIMRCPLCRGRVPTKIWASFVDQEVYDKYAGNAFALLSMRCPACDNTVSFAP
ncbi:unnamed protein product, partial [Effrenium voratum]